MPYASKAQQGYFHAHPDKVGRKVVAEFDAASKGQKNLPQHVKKKRKMSLHNKIKSGMAKAFPKTKGGY